MKAYLYNECLVRATTALVCGVLALGEELRAPLIAGAPAYQLYTAASAAGLGERNAQELGKLIERWAGVRINAPRDEDPARS